MEILLAPGVCHVRVGSGHGESRDGDVTVGLAVVEDIKLLIRCEAGRESHVEQAQFPVLKILNPVLQVQERRENTALHHQDATCLFGDK